MSTITQPTRTETTTRTPRRSNLSRAMSFARAELKMLLRNKTAITNVVLMPLILLAALAASGALDNAGSGLGNAVLVSGVVIAIAYVVYYNLVTTYVARRESYVLKRMRTGPVSDLGVIAASSLPSVLLSLVQIAVVVIALIAWGKPPSLVNVVAVLLAVLLGTLAFASLAIMSTGFTRTAETAQITTLPVVMVTMAASGMFFPLSLLPDWAAQILHFTPGAAIVDLLNLGLSGTTVDGDRVPMAETWMPMITPSLVLIAWTAAGLAYLRRDFRWEPRR